MAKFLNNWILVLGLAALICVGCKQSNPKDVKQMTVAELQAAVKQGNTQAMVVLGLDYDTGRGLIKDAGEAFNWFQKAALQGNEGGQHALGECYLRGVGTETNFATAFSWFQRAAKSGYGKAQVELAKCYRDGLGVKENQIEAFNWFKKAAYQGNPFAEEQTSIYYALAPLSGDRNDASVEAYKWITLVGSKDQQLADNALNTIKQRGIVFSPEQIAGGKQRAEEFMKTNQFSTPSTSQINGL